MLESVYLNSLNGRKLTEVKKASLHFRVSVTRRVGGKKLRNALISSTSSRVGERKF